MIPGLSNVEWQAFRDAVRAPGAEGKTRATVMDLDHTPQGTLRTTGGQVRWNRSADVNTSATISSDDARDALDLDLRHLVKMEMGIQTVSQGFLWCPVMTGWVVNPVNAGDTAELGLHDKMAFGLQPTKRQKFGENRYVGDVIREMFEAIGETRFNIPRRLREDGPKLGRVVHVGGHDPKKAPTRMARLLAKRSNLQVFPDPEGRLTVRRPPKNPSVVWTEDDETDARLTSPITWDRDLTTIRNRVVGKGRKGIKIDKKADDPDQLQSGFLLLPVVIEAPPNHIYSPRRLKRGGVPMDLTHYFTDESIDSQKELREATEGVLRRLLTDRAEVSLSSSVVPWTRSHDLLHARRLDGGYADFFMREGSMGLDWSGMTIGYQRVWRRA